MYIILFLTEGQQLVCKVLFTCVIYMQKFESL